MSSINWPSAINYYVERNNYSIDPHDDNARTDFDKGPARVRQRFTTSRALVTLRWQFTAAEMAFFEAFYKYGLREGTRWFNMPMYTADNYVMREVRFVNKYTPANDGSAFDWVISAVVELRELPTYSFTAYFLVMFFGTQDAAEGFTDRLAYLINVEYPHITAGLP